MQGIIKITPNIFNVKIYLRFLGRYFVLSENFGSAIGPTWKECNGYGNVGCSEDS